MKNRFLSPPTWLFIALTMIEVVFLFKFVDLVPQVNYDVFFSSDDPGYKADVGISESFQRNDSQVLISFTGDIHQPFHQSQIKQFGDMLLKFDEVASVKSVMHGPRSVNKALSSPFWQRLLISDNGLSSNMFVTLKPDIWGGDLSQFSSKLEHLKAVFETDGFNIKISGFPYITELIRRHLNQDLRTFTLLAFFIFGLVVILIFHSWKIFLGMVVSCLNAAVLTFICSHLFNIKIGILTANLSTIIFVITLSHIVFLTFNWRHLHHIADSKEAAREAVNITFPASFWAMATTLLGFISLLNVQAKPIRELGAAGSIGTLLAFVMALGVYPAFLGLVSPSREKPDTFVKDIYQKTFYFFEQRKWLVVGAIFGIMLFTLPNLKSLNLDPSLISFFSPKSEITKGLKYIDQHGGSNPLVIVVKSKSPEPLTTKASVKQLMELQLRLENHPQVGTLLSMPLLLEEARRSSWLSFLFSNKTLLKWMSSPKYDEIAKGFISEDYTSTLLLFRMNEEGRHQHRLDIIAEIKKIIEEYNFVPTLTGGIYALQGNLSKHVASSLIFGLGWLLLIFVGIAFAAARSLRTALAMSVSIGIIPLCILGIIATLKIPLDIVAAPAANIAISMGIDAMLHMVNIYRRLSKTHSDPSTLWAVLRARMWEPVMTSMLIVSSGFAIFFFSSFPPTVRFGGSIVLGTVISAFSALFIFSLLANFAGQIKFFHPANHPIPPTDRTHHFKQSDLN
ncbi:MAG: MMPL family transporter [Candidatus Omnitrophota bacterium]|nr:MMPL family transporter [Candidatus Omnitrophota bacterium]